jgi:hypothetical protein
LMAKKGAKYHEAWVFVAYPEKVKED